MDLVGTTLGQFEVLEELGRGGMATVYRAYQPNLKRNVALKVLLPSLAQDRNLVQRFLREAEAAAALKHPHVITIHDIGSQGEIHYIVAEYLDGMTLAHLLTQEGQLGSERVLHIVRQVADALDYAHAQGYIHRDIKPSNIMVDLARNDYVTLMDFGLVRVIGGSQITRTGAIVGTPDYMSPEQAKGEELDQRTDIYSLGVTVYHMLTGSVPFGKPTPHAVMMAHVTEEPPSMTSLGQQTPLEVEAVVIKSMAKEPSDRYQWAGEMARDLENAITCTGLSAADTLDELATPPASRVYRASPMVTPPVAAPATERQAGKLSVLEPISQDLSTEPSPVAAPSTRQKTARPKWLWPLVGVASAGLLVVVILSCVFGIRLIGVLMKEVPTATAIVATQQPEATAIPPPSEDPTYQEDFTTPGREWEIGTGENAEFRIEGGVYSILVTGENWSAWNSLGQEFGDFEIALEVALVEGASHNDAGVLFRFQDEENYYELDVNGEGSFAVGKKVDGEWDQVLEWAPSSAIHALGSVNRVRLIAQGDRFEVIINDHTIAHFVDDTHPSGTIATVVTAYDDPPARATFDNIRIWDLGP